MREQYKCLLHSVIRVHEHDGLLFISLNALFMFHEQCKRHYKKINKKTQTQLRETQIQTLTKIINHFTIQLIFNTIYGSHCTFWYYS